VTARVDAAIDLSAIVFRGKRADDRWFCFELPERDGFVLAALGEADVVRSEGPDRFGAVADHCRRIAGTALVDDAAADPSSPPASGPVWVGGFAFDDHGGTGAHWNSLSPAHLVLPEVALVRIGGEARLTVSALVAPGESADAVVARVEARLQELDPAAAMPMADPDLVAPPRVAGAAPPEHYEGAVARAVELIKGGSLEKVVLAREVLVHARRAIDPAPVFDALRTVFPGCYCFCAGTSEAAFLGASPELLVRREGARAQTVALAGTSRRSADPSVDRLLGEQLLQSDKDREEHEIVARRIVDALRPVSVWVTVADDPALVKVHNVQHLATPIRAQLAEPVSAVELAGRLHPTPAVGGEPWAVARPLIPALEGLDRGWYAGPVGWTDLGEDGEFCVALRCALLRDEVGRLYAGDGIVRDSLPSSELAETEVKLQALLPLLT